MKRKILIGLGLIFIIIQFFRIDKTPPSTPPNAMGILQVHPDGDSIGHLLKTACFDCHSNHTRYPWYSNIAPVSWWLQDHVEHGRKHLNFSIWSTYPEKKANHKMEECIEMIETGEMPMKSYIIAHSDARLSESQKEELIKWFKKHN